MVIAENDWSKSLADFIRNNDKPIIEACDKLLGVYQDEMLPCESFGEFCDVVGKLFLVLLIETFEVSTIFWLTNVAMWLRLSIQCN